MFRNARVPYGKRYVDHHWMFRSSGQCPVFPSEVKTIHIQDTAGWRPGTTSENTYRNEVLMGGWNERWFDIKQLSQVKAMPSQYDHYFETTYGAGYNSKYAHQVPEELRHLKSRHPMSFPVHQPELDSRELKAIYGSYETTSGAAYIDPLLQRNPALMENDLPPLPPIRTRCPSVKTTSDPAEEQDKSAS